MERARFWETREDNSVECGLCRHFCLISEGDTGLCGVRENQHDELYSLNYGKLISANPDPIEKKPLFHFLPGSSSYSIAATGCNLRCQWCQNWSISQTSARNHPNRFEFVPAQAVISAAMRLGCKSIAYTYTEPTVFYEYAKDVSLLARQNNLKNIWVSNGYMSAEMLAEYLPLLDAANIDLKAFDDQVYRKYTGARLQPVLDNCVALKKAGVWLEVTTLLVPGINDDAEQILGLAEFIHNHLGSETPWHVSRYFPQEQFSKIAPTDPKTIQRALEVGSRVGLRYVYAGNLRMGEDTRCPDCGALLLARNSVWLMSNQLQNGHCPKCGKAIAGVWE